MSVIERLRLCVIGRFGKILMWLWGKSSRLSVMGKDAYDKVRQEGKPVVYLIWHSRIFLIPYYFRRSGAVALVSPSTDGEMMAQIMSRWGYEIIRGSSSHPVAGAWKAMIRCLNEGKEVLIVPDGPRGPNRVMKPGGLKLAMETGAVLVPWTYSAKRKKIFDSWDQFILFYPFSRLLVRYGDPVPVSRDMTREGLEIERKRLEKALTTLEKEADRYFL